MDWLIWVFKSRRLIEPFCESLYTMSGSLGAGTEYSPSPPVVVYQAPLPTLLWLKSEEGPHQALLSCKPPQML